MNRRITFIVLIAVVFGIQGLFAQFDLPEPVFMEPLSLEKREVAFVPGLRSADFSDAVYYLWNFDRKTAFDKGDFNSRPPVTSILVSSAGDSTAVPGNIRNNRYFVESVRLTNLAQESFEYGDYDASTNYAEEALRYARLSDEYVALQLKIRETDQAIAAARTRLNWAASVKAADRYPREYSRAQSDYAAANTARSGENWDEAIAAAGRVIDALAYVEEAPPQQPVLSRQPERPKQPELPPLPAQYTVRPWAVSKDCFWNIAGRAWVYGDPAKWRLIYNANKAKLPQPDNPDLIHPGLILDIPSVKGESRQGMWEANRTYTPLR
jgi:hypothetical protein